MPKTPKKSRGKRKKIVTIVVVVLLLVLAAGIGVLVQLLQHKSGSNTSNSQTGNSKAALTQDTLPQSVKDAQNSALKGDINQSNKQIASSLATTDNNDEKFDLYLQQGINYENQSKWDDALNSYKQAEAIKQTYSLYKSMGRVAEAKGDKASALSYYKKALPLVPTNDPLHDFYVNQIQAKITQLGG